MTHVTRPVRVPRWQDCKLRRQCYIAGVPLAAAAFESFRQSHARLRDTLWPPAIFPGRLSNLRADPERLIDGFLRNLKGSDAELAMDTALSIEMPVDDYVSRAADLSPEQVKHIRATTSALRQFSRDINRMTAAEGDVNELCFHVTRPSPRAHACGAHVTPRLGRCLGRCLP